MGEDYRYIQPFENQFSENHFHLGPGSEYYHDNEAATEDSYSLQDVYQEGKPEETIRPNSSFLFRIYKEPIGEETDWWLHHQKRAHSDNDTITEKHIPLPEEPDVFAIDHHPHRATFHEEDVDPTSFHVTPQFDEEEEEEEPTKDYDVDCLDRRARHTIGLIFLGVLLVAVAGGGIMVYIAFLSPLRDDKTSNSCETSPPKFGENCEFRCHCSNLSEICDRHTGNCFSGCIDGWEGKNCHTIKSIFDKSAINAKPNSSESVQCFIQKLWYSWSNVYLTFHNDTRLLTLINVSQSGNIMSFDHRINASLKITTEMEADIVTFFFNFGEGDCALTGMYECRFDMVDNFTLLYGNLSMKVQGMSKNLHLSTKKAYLIDSNDKISCNLQLAEPDTEVFLTFTDINNNTLNSTDVKVSKQLLKTSTAECTNLTTFMYEFNVTTELNQSTVQCIMRNESGEIYLKSNSAVINVVSVLTSVNGVMDPPSHDIMIQNKTELSCYFNVSSFEWDAVRLDFQNDSLASKTIVRLTNSSRAWHAGQINATLKVDSSFVNVTFVLDFATPKDACSLSGIYTCSIEMVDKHIATESDSTSLNFSVPVSDLSLHLLPRYQYGTYDFINCSADTMEPATTTLSLEVCDSDSTFVPFEMYNISFVVFNETGLKNENCSQQILLSYQVLFNSQMNVSLRCSVHDSYRNTALPTSCSMPEISTALVVGVMDPSSHNIMIENKTELFCYFNVSSFEWDAVLLDFQNESSISRRIVRLTNGSRAWHEGQINATLREDSSFVNVTVVLDFATPKDACSLSGIYTCSIEMVDKHIATESDSTSLNFSVPVSDLSLHLLPRYQYGTYDFVNCSANTMKPATTTLSLEVCDADSTFIPFEMYNTSFVVYNETGLKNENCSQQILLNYQVLFNSQMNVSLRCSFHDSFKNTTLPTSCRIPEISTALVIGVMDPPSHDIMIENKTELFCYFNVSSFEWDAVLLDFQNESSISRRIVRLTNGSRDWHEGQINATLREDSSFVNVTVVLDFATPKDACSLSGIYTCSIEMVDKHIATESDSTSLNFSVPVSDLSLHLLPRYQYGTYDFVNCSANTMEPSTTTLSLDICNSDSTFTPIQKFVDTTSLNETSLKNENCTYKLMLSHLIYFNNQTGVSFRCSVKNSNLNATMESNCTTITVVPQLVTAEMSPTVFAKLGTVTEMICSIQTKGLAWTSASIRRHNKTASTVILTIHNDSRVESRDSKINGTGNIGVGFVNITVLIDTSSDSEICELNKNYSCDIDIIDSSIQTIAANSSFMIQAQLSAINISTESSYLSGSNSTIDCTVDHGDIRDTNVFLEVCQNGSFENLEATELVTRDVLKLDNDTDVSCSNKTLFRFHILMMDSRNGSSFRCHGKDDLYNISLPTRCVSISVTQVKAIVEPAKIYGELNSTVSFQCRIPLSRSYFSAFQLLNKSSHPILAINFDNYTIQPQNDRVFAVYTSDQFDEYRAVNFTFDLRSGDDVCNIAGVYICRVTSFNESLLLPGENESQLAIAASPSEITLEIKDSYPEKEINQTINCTALLNPDTTTLALVRLSNESYTIVPKNITKTSIQPTRTDDCRHLVKLIVSTTFDRFNQSTVACLAKDVVFGDFFSVNKTIFIVKNDNP